MRDGISWRGSHRRQQEYYSPNQSLVLPSGRQARSRRAANVLVLFLILCFVTWTLTRFRTPPIDSLPQPVPTRAVVLELFRYHRHPEAHNRSFTALAPVHQRRRGLLGDSGTRASAPQEIFEEEEQEDQASDGQGVSDNLSRKFASFKRRTRSHSDHEVMACSQEASSSRPAALGKYKWHVGGGARISDRELKPFFAEVPIIGASGNSRGYHLILDTGSGITWVNCQGPLIGDNGWFRPAADSFVNCEEDRDLCKKFQGGVNYPCVETDKFRCLFECTYLDGSEAQGSIINAVVLFDLSDDSVPPDKITMAFGCANEGKGADREDRTGEDEDDEPTSDGGSDGTLGLGRHPSSWLRQLYFKGLVSEYVVAVCLEPAPEPAPDLAPEPAGPVQYPIPSPFESAGFISFGDLYTSQAASTIWTTSIVPGPTNRERESEAIFEARLVEIEYRENPSNSRSSDRRPHGDIVVAGVQMGFDTGSGLTYLPPGIFSQILKILDEDAIRMGYQKSKERLIRNSIRRRCWRGHGIERKKSLVGEFGDLIMKFSPLAGGDTTSDFVIKPENYLTFGGDKTIRTCFNMDKTSGDSPSGILGGEAMRGHLLIFREQTVEQIGWSPVTSCKNLR